ncbi:Surf6 [Symbiodinium microadriaticum]|nr:Surf6 [Symbiodinium microadriaticum]
MPRSKNQKRTPEGDADDLVETRRKARRINHYLDLVPARYYLGTESAQAKGGKWAHLDPKLAKSTTQLIAEAATAEDQPATASKKKKNRDRRSLSQSPEPSGPNSRAELREKLNRRIAELQEERRRKQSEADKAKAAEIRAAREKAPAAAAPNGVKANHKSEARSRNGAAKAEDEEEPEAGRVSFDAEASGLPFEAGVGQRGRKVKKLQAELRKQEADAAKLREAELRGKGEELRKEQAYEKALQRARGEKVHDDVSKLRKVQKTMEMKKKKGQDRWNAKMESDKQKAEERQAQRKENLQSRGTKKKNQMQRRMGFEGKRTSFLNSE